MTFKEFIKSEKLLSLDEILRQLLHSSPTVISFFVDLQQRQLHIGESDYLLGVADLTGELMRLCVSSVSQGAFDYCHTIRRFLQQIFNGCFLFSSPKGFSSLSLAPRDEINKKLKVMESSLRKVEAGLIVCLAH